VLTHTIPRNDAGDGVETDMSMLKRNEKLIKAFLQTV